LPERSSAVLALESQRFAPVTRNGPCHRRDVEQPTVSASRLAFCNQMIHEVGLVRPRRDDRKRVPALGDDEPLTVPDSPEVTAQILTELAHTDPITHLPNVAHL
jgi:hypothetical protein